MKSVLAWVDKCQDKERNRNDQCIYDLAFKPDGTELLVASGARVLVYDGNDGTLTQTLRGHKDTVYCIDYALNGQRFATGSADKSVIIWTEQHEGILKYNHSDAMQCLAFSPSSAALVSCAVTDFGLWAADQKSVSKHKVPSRICSCTWSRDGQTFAVGLYSGTILLRHKNGEEKNRTDRPNGAPIWAMKFSTGKYALQDLFSLYL